MPCRAKKTEDKESRNDPRQEDRPRHLRDARSRPADRVLHRRPRADAGRRRKRTRPTSPRPSTIIRWCCARASHANACGSASRSGPTTTSTRSRSRPRRTASRRSARTTPSPRSPRWSPSRIPKGTVMEVFKRGEFAHQKFPTKGIVPHKLGHVAFFVKDVKKRHRLLLRRARLPRVGLDGRLLLVPALRRRPPHHQPDAGPGGPALPHRVRAARLGPHADRLRLPQPQRLQAAVGAGPPRHRPQPVRLSPRAERPDHRTVRRSSTR